MVNNIYVKIKNILKDNYKEIIFLILFYIIMSFPMPYYIYIGGGTINLDNRYEIENDNKINGSYNLAYVSELKATTATYLLSFVMPNWDKVSVENYKATTTENIEDIEKRNKIALESANQTAVILAYKKAGAECNITKTKNYITYIDEKVDANIKVGDILTKADGIIINDINDYKDIIAKKEVNDKIKLTLLRKNKEITTDIKIQMINNTKLTGIGIAVVYEYNTSPSITFNFKEHESGSSGGLMVALSIYDSLTKEDLSNGLKIVGTGTIESDGTIGEIGGIKYKLLGAVKAKADVFLVPEGSNYEEIKKIQEEKNYNIKIIMVKSLDDAIEKLKNLK
jgi:Predicted secreted protein containing a PDZ domain